MRFRIVPTSPYDFDLTVGTYGKFEGEAVDNYAAGIYRRVINIGDRYMLVSVESVGTVNQPILSVSVHPESPMVEESEVRRKVENMLSTNDDLLVFYSTIAKDPVLSKVRDDLYGLRPPKAESLYEALIIAITEQQISLRAALVIRGRIARRYGEKIRFQGREYYAFPSQSAFANVKARGLIQLGLSRGKAEYVMDLSRKVSSGELNLEEIAELPTGELITTLMKIKGIGRWTAEYATVRGLGRLDALPADDAALRRVISNLYYGGREVSEQDVRELLDQWGQYRGYAAFYLLSTELSER